MSALPKAYLYGDTGRHVVVAGVLHELVEMTVPASLVDALEPAGHRRGLRYRLLRQDHLE